METQRKSSPQRLAELELEGTLVTGSRRRSFGFPQGGGGRAREVGWGGGARLLGGFPARAPIIAGRLWFRLRPSKRLPPLADTKVAESWRCIKASVSVPWRTLVNPSRRSLSTKPTLTGSGLALAGLGDERDGFSRDELGRSGCGARPKFNPYTS